jgi:cytidylate kinase
MVVIFLDGESKGGKTAVGRHITDSIKAKGFSVKLVVSGNFFRAVTLLALKRLNSSPTDGELLAVVFEVLQLPEVHDDYPQHQLQSPEVDALVSRVGRLDVVQTAIVTWRWAAAKNALDDGIDVLIFDGRNLRSKLHDWMEAKKVKTALELIIYCRPEVAAGRYLAAQGKSEPSADELTKETETIQSRRDMDRKRNEAAYQDPVDPIKLVAGIHNAKQAVADAYGPDVADPPRPIIFDNSEVPLKEGLATVEELATEAVQRFIGSLDKSA